MAQPVLTKCFHPNDESSPSQQHSFHRVPNQCTVHFVVLYVPPQKATSQRVRPTDFLETGRASPTLAMLAMLCTLAVMVQYIVAR